MQPQALKPSDMRQKIILHGLTAKACSKQKELTPAIQLHDELKKEDIIPPLILEAQVTKGEHHILYKEDGVLSLEPTIEDFV